ncbi:MAG: chlorite dismutase family protein [Bacteroidetes bacterium]|nr:chlorite dismutase family protein [Bacteroidota bacterium]
MESTTNTGIISFFGAEQGPWKIASMQTLIGAPLPEANCLNIQQSAITPDQNSDAKWILRGFISNLRYTHRSEKTMLDAHSKPLGRAAYHAAALIPIQKSKECWNLAQDERRRIFEEDSKHIQQSAEYLQYISRQLHHSRDLGEAFDFLTWFEFAPEHTEKFDALCAILRKTEEWQYVTREIDIRLLK